MHSLIDFDRAGFILIIIVIFYVTLDCLGKHRALLEKESRPWNFKNH